MANEKEGDMKRRKVLILLHAEPEGPGSLGPFLDAWSGQVEALRLFDGERIRLEPDDLAAAVSMGGPMNVYEEDRYPFLREETVFLRRAVEAGLPVLGVCLGAQMIAKACGARVRKSPQKEVGWFDVFLTRAGRLDPLFSGLPETFGVLQWHEDMFEVPRGGRLLASAAGCPHQAFRYRNAYGLQFHVEVTREMVSEWFAGREEGPGILEEFDRRQQTLAALAERIYANFWSLVVYR